MGNLLQTSNQNQFEEVMKKFILIGQYNHKQLGNIKVFKLKENEEINIFQKNLNALSNEQSQELIKKFELRKEYKHDNLIRFLHCYNQTNQMLCSELFQFTITAEYYQHTLSEEIEKDIMSLKHCNESRLWQIAYDLIDVCSFLEEHNTFHGDISLQKIYTDTNGKIKLIEHSFLPDGLDNYQKAYRNEEFVLLAPEQLQSLQKGLQFFEGNQSKSDVFVIGLVLLEIAAQQSSASYYNWQRKSIDLKMIQNYIKDLVNIGYSSVIQKFIGEMINDYKNRPSFIEIKNGLQPLKKDIENQICFYKQYIQPQTNNNIQKNQFQTFGGQQ